MTEVGLSETKINLMSSMQGLNVFPTNWLFKKVLRLSDKEIAEIQFMKMIEDKNQQAQQMAMGGGMGMPGGAGMPPAGGELPDMNTATDIGNELPPGGELPPEGELPPAGGELPPEGGAEAPPLPQNLETQEVSYLNVEGQKFLIENKNDFITLMKYIKQQNKNKNSKTSEFMEEINSYGKKKKKAIVKSINPYYSLEENNEFGGLLKYNGSARLYEGTMIKDIPVLNG